MAGMLKRNSKSRVDVTAGKPVYYGTTYVGIN